MKKYTYLVTYNYFHGTCGGHKQEFVVVNEPIVSKEHIEEVYKHLHVVKELTTIQVLSISLMNIE